MKKLLLLLITTSFIVFNVQAQIIYVDAGANGSETGFTWADAHTDLQTAIYEAVPGDTLWVKQGTYKPLLDTLGAIPPVPESRSIWLKNGVVIYGGFNGTETSLSQRDPINLKATLEGEVIPNTFSEHVIYVYEGIDSTAVMDGFIVQNGKTTPASAIKSGAGVLLWGDAQFYNMVFKNNTGEEHGAGVYAITSASRFVSCRFENNTCNQYDGAACNFVSSDITMYNCVFHGNHANRFGGAITTVQSDLLVQNGTFVGNTAGVNIFQISTSGQIDFNHCIFTADNSAPAVLNSSGANGSFMEGLMPNDNDWLILCPTCWAGAPTFVNGAGGDFSLAAGSLGIDDTLAVSPMHNYADIAGNPRVVGAYMDLGAYEYQGPVGISPPTATREVTVYPNPTKSQLSILAEDGIEEVAMYNVLGERMQIEGTDKFSVAHLAAGIYFLQIRTASGTAVVRFVKE